MKIKILERAGVELRLQWLALQRKAVSRAFPLLKGWMVKNDPWVYSNYPPKVTNLTTLKMRLRQRLAYFLWDRVSEANQSEVALTQMFVQPTEWNCDEQVDIERRIHGLPIIDPETPMTTEPAREVLPGCGPIPRFKVVMKRGPAPKPARMRRKRTRKAA
jgi:hypothetical protein